MNLNILLNLNSLIVLVSILVSVAFYTILERKILSYIQTRKGPNKVGFVGTLQPFSDAIKLFNKSITLTTLMNNTLIFISPALSFSMALLIWPLLPFANFNVFDSIFNTLIFFIISSISVYFMILTGWAANSKYSQLGTMRSIAQMISYEVNFFIFFLIFLMMFHSYSLTHFNLPQMYLWFLAGFFPMLLIWTTTCIAEVNRSPFDFAEGESELVSGFNVEYMGGLFALIFLAEYTSMLTLSFITTILFTGKLNSPLSMLCILTTAIMFLWVRGTEPRSRYDILMKLNWKILLPTSIFILFSISCFSLIFF